MPRRRARRPGRVPRRLPQRRARGACVRARRARVEKEPRRVEFFSTLDRRPSWTLDDAARLEAGYRVVFVSRAPLLGRAVRSEARAMINTTDVFALWLGGVVSAPSLSHSTHSVRAPLWLAIFFARSTQRIRARVRATTGRSGSSIPSEPRPEKYWTLLGGRAFPGDSDGASAAFAGPRRVRDAYGAGARRKVLRAEAPEERE